MLIMTWLQNNVPVSTIQKSASREMSLIAVQVPCPFFTVSASLHMCLPLPQWSQPVTLISGENKAIQPSQGKHWFTFYVSAFKSLKHSAGQNHSISICCLMYI